MKTQTVFYCCLHIKTTFPIAVSQKEEILLLYCSDYHHLCAMLKLHPFEGVQDLPEGQKQHVQKENPEQDAAGLLTTSLLAETQKMNHRHQKAFQSAGCLWFTFCWKV